MIGRNKIIDTNQDWYDEIDGSRFSEASFELNLITRIQYIYKEFICIPFKITITGSSGNRAKPDLALIKNDYSEWYFVEVEMDRHPWETHVRTQVEVFLTGNYNKDNVVDYCLTKYESFDRSLLLQMVDRVPPKVLVIVNDDIPEWSKELKRMGAYLSVFQIYRGTNGFDVYRVSGYVPQQYRDRVQCHFLNNQNNMLMIDGQNILQNANGEIIQISYRGKISEWKISINKKEHVHLIPQGYLTIPADKAYILGITKENEYFLEIA